MEKYIYEKNNGLWYERRGDYYFPCLTAEEASPVGVWGQRHMRYITQNRRARYLELKTTGRQKACLTVLWCKWPSRRALRRHSKRSIK